LPIATPLARYNRRAVQSASIVTHRPTAVQLPARDALKFPRDHNAAMSAAHPSVAARLLFNGPQGNKEQSMNQKVTSRENLPGGSVGMIRYFERVPAAAAWSDGTRQYAYGRHSLKQLPDGRFTVAEGEREILRQVEFVENGEAYLAVGCAGEKIAVLANLPFAVTAQNSSIELCDDLADRTPPQCQEAGPTPSVPTNESRATSINTETATIEKLRAYVLQEVGSAEVFDACATDVAKRDYVADYIEACEKHDAAEEDYYDRMMRGD